MRSRELLGGPPNIFRYLSWVGVARSFESCSLNEQLGSRRDLAPQMDENLSQIRPYFALRSRVAQEIGGVKSRHHRDSAFIEPKFAAYPRDSVGDSQETSDRRPPERDDHLRVQELKLSLKIPTATFHLNWGRTAIVRGTALHHIADVDVIRRKAHRHDHLV